MRPDCIEVTPPTFNDDLGLAQRVEDFANSADGAINLPLFGNAFQGVGAEIVELNARARN